LYENFISRSITATSALLFVFYLLLWSLSHPLCIFTFAILCHIKHRKLAQGQAIAINNTFNYFNNFSGQVSNCAIKCNTIISPHLLCNIFFCICFPLIYTNYYASCSCAILDTASFINIFIFKSHSSEIIISNIFFCVIKHINFGMLMMTRCNNKRVCLRNC
jgi:hypothetical protein